MKQAIGYIIIAIIAYAPLLYLSYWFFIGRLKDEVKRQAGVRRLSDKYITATGDIVRMHKGTRA